MYMNMSMHEFIYQLGCKKMLDPSWRGVNQFCTHLWGSKIVR